MDGDDDGEEDEDEDEMAALLGFSGFSTTKVSCNHYTSIRLS